MGMITPVGNDVATTWRALLAGESGAANITKFDASTWPVRFACEVKGFDPLLYMDRKEAKRADWYTQYAVAASVQAMKQAGLIGFTKSVAKELASRNILANVVAPGYIETDMTAAMTPQAKETLSKLIPLERLGTAGDIAGMVVFLCSEHAAYITGQVFVVDGGMVM